MIVSVALPSKPLPKGSRVDHYELRAFLDEGGMGSVYRALDTRIGKDVAVKMLAPPADGKPMTEQLKQRFLREVLAISRIRHPNVVQVHDYGFTEEGLPYMVMDLLEGQDLNKILKATREPLATSYAVDIMMEVCSALRACHRVGVVHRDLKPANIFLTTTETGHGWQVKIIDFGVAKAAIAGELTEHGQIVGTWQYLSPEQVDGNAGPASDQYAIGVMLYQCLTRKLPYGAFKGTAVLKAIDKGEFAKPREHRPDAIPEGVERIILQAMDVSPEKRFESVYALGQQLWEFASPLGQELWKKYYFHSPVPAALPPQMTSGIAISIVQDLTEMRGRQQREQGELATEVADYQGTTSAQLADQGVGRNVSNADLLVPTRPPTAADGASTSASPVLDGETSEVAIEMSWNDRLASESDIEPPPADSIKRHIFFVLGGIVVGASVVAVIGLALHRSPERLIRPAPFPAPPPSAGARETSPAPVHVDPGHINPAPAPVPVPIPSGAKGVPPVEGAQESQPAPRKKGHRTRPRKELELTPDGLPVLP